MAIKHTFHARYNPWYHFAWSTKYRNQIWKDAQQKKDVKQLLRAIASQHDMEIGTIEICTDHIHFTLTAPPMIAPARAAQIIKSVCTHKLFQQYPELKR